MLATGKGSLIVKRKIEDMVAPPPFLSSSLENTSSDGNSSAEEEQQSFTEKTNTEPIQTTIPPTLKIQIPIRSGIASVGAVGSSPNRKRGSPRRDRMPTLDPDKNNFVKVRMAAYARFLASEKLTKEAFLEELGKFMESRGLMLPKAPLISNQPLDLLQLMRQVMSRGGCDAVGQQHAWKSVYQELHLPAMSTSASYNLRTNYKKYLYLYEHFLAEQTELQIARREPIYGLDQYVRVWSNTAPAEAYVGRIVWRRLRPGSVTGTAWEYYLLVNGWSMAAAEWIPEKHVEPLKEEEVRLAATLPNPPPKRTSTGTQIINPHQSSSGDEDEPMLMPSMRRSSSNNRHRRAKSQFAALTKNDGNRSQGGRPQTTTTFPNLFGDMDRLRMIVEMEIKALEKEESEKRGETSLSSQQQNLTGIITAKGPERRGTVFLNPRPPIRRENLPSYDPLLSNNESQSSFASREPSIDSELIHVTRMELDARRTPTPLLGLMPPPRNSTNPALQALRNYAAARNDTSSDTTRPNAS